jgi:thiol-disulfide isomerase/thioredoxin
MSSGKIVIITLLAGILSVGAGVLLQDHLNPPSTSNGDASLIPQPLAVLSSLPDFTLTDLEGNPRDSRGWAGKILVLNFWATWCPPCRRELPAFIELQQELGGKGLQFVGIAIDSPEAVRDFAESMAFNFPVLLGDEQAIAMSRRLGNRHQGLPFSVIFDRDGKVLHTQAGELTPEILRDKIAHLL